MAEQVQNDVESESNFFDALAFAEQLYSTIDTYRSQISANYDEIITSAPLSPGGVGETKLNAFYRMLGLPAIANPTLIDKNLETKDFKKKISQDGTINYFHTIYSREEQVGLFAKVQARNNKLISPANRERFAEFMFKPTSLSASVKNPDSGQSIRSSIFPLVVDAAVPVFPLNRRLAPSFQHTINGEDYITMGSKTRLSRPLIDNILYMRIKTINNTEGIDRLESQLNNLLSTVDIKVETSNFTFVDLVIRTKLLQILKSLASKFDEARKEAQALSSQIFFVFTPVSNPLMRSSQSTDIRPEAKIYSLDYEIAQLKAEIAEQNAIAFMLPTEQVKRREEIRRLEHGISTSNITPDVLISQLNNLITYESEELNRRLQEKQHERDEKLTRVEQLKQQLMYYTGEFSGLSIFDVICIIYGLFSIKLEDLLGLLNEDAQRRLKEDEFFRPPEATFQALFDAEPRTVGESLRALESKVTEAFNIAESFASAQVKTQ